MRFLLDQDVYATTARFLTGLGHSGVLYLRVLPSTQNSVHKELERVLNTYSEEELKKAFVVIEPDGHRFRRLPSK